MSAFILTVAFGGALAAGTSDTPQIAVRDAAVQQPAPNPPVPLPTGPPVDTCSPSSADPACHFPTGTTHPPPPATPLPPITELPLPTACFPGQIGCIPGSATTAPPTTSTTPCSGEDCIPQPSPPLPGTPGQPGDPGSAGGDSECGITTVLTDLDGCINEAINAVFRNLVKSAMDPVLKLLGDTAFTTPTLDSLPGVTDLWNNSWLIVVGCYSGLIMIGGIIVMSHESIQSRYSIKEIGPRLVVSFFASMLSLFVIDKAIRLANALTTAVLGTGVDPPKLGDTLSETINGAYSAAVSGGLFVVLLEAALLIGVIALLLIYVVRVIITLILIVSAPMWVACHALPHTDGIARWCERALAATLGIQIAQALTLIVALDTFLSGSVHLFNSVGGGLVALFAVLGLLYILFKIPSWFLSATKLGTGRSFLGGLVKAVIMAKTFGAIAGKGGAFGSTGSGRALTTARAGGGRGGSADPPWPAQPRIAPTPAAVNKRMQQTYDAERARAAAQSRSGSHTPQFLQPGPQTSTHDPATGPAPQGASTMPEFTSAPSPTTPPTLSKSQRRDRPLTPLPQFQAAGVRRRQGHTAPPARPVRLAAVPPQLKFQPPTPAPVSAARPAVPVTPAPAAPEFRTALPAQHIGDARPRTQSVPPLTFRAPAPPPAPPTPTPREGKK